MLQTESMNPFPGIFGFVSDTGEVKLERGKGVNCPGPCFMQRAEIR